ncbi:hypothetical protein LINPERPRIM_LOCUS1823 [Linum perenne]
MDICLITRAEIVGIIKELEMAWSLGIMIIRVQANSSAATMLLSDSNMSSNQHDSLVLDFRELISKSWKVWIPISFTHQRPISMDSLRFG